VSTIKTKYNLKQVVYNAYCVNEGYYVKCEDCNGTGHWDVTGKDIKVGCQTCNKGDHYWNTPGKTQHYKYFPRVQELTIGQIQATVGYNANIRYMCKETGLGSGSLWAEDSLTDNEAFAREVAKELAGRKNDGEEVEVEDLYVQMGGV
jgi:hypothetical protein